MYRVTLCVRDSNTCMSQDLCVCVTNYICATNYVPSHVYKTHFQHHAPDARGVGHAHEQRSDWRMPRTRSTLFLSLLFSFSLPLTHFRVEWLCLCAVNHMCGTSESLTHELYVCSRWLTNYMSREAFVWHASVSISGCVYACVYASGYASVCVCVYESHVCVCVYESHVPDVRGVAPRHDVTNYSYALRYYVTNYLYASHAHAHAQHFLHQVHMTHMNSSWHNLYSYPWFVQFVIRASRSAVRAQGCHILYQVYGVRKGSCSRTKIWEILYESRPITLYQSRPIYMSHELCIWIVNYAYLSRTMYMSHEVFSTWCKRRWPCARKALKLARVTNYTSHELYESRTIWVACTWCKRRWPCARTALQLAVQWCSPVCAGSHGTRMDESCHAYE